MKKAFSAAAIAAAVILSLLPGRAVNADTGLKSLPDGLSLSFNGETVELRVATADTFLLHVFLPAAAPFPVSTYLSTNNSGTLPFTVVKNGEIVGIKDAAGALELDTSNSTWSLLGSSGVPITGWASIGQTAGGSMTLSVGGTPSNASPLYYGSGNMPNLGSLTQSAVNGGTDNGRTSLPQYWNSGGYGALLVGQYDDRPGSWQSTASGVNLTVPGASASLYLAPAPTLYDWTRDDGELTGFAPVPPRWSFGYMQSRWGWANKAYIDDTYSHFVADNIPVDVFIFDFEWYTSIPDYDVPPQGDPKFTDFGWNPNLFPDPTGQIAAFAQEGLKVVGIRKPRLGNSANLTMARAKGWVQTNTNGQSNISSRNIDFSNPAVRAWYASNIRKFYTAGVSGFWNDEGEKVFTEYYYWNLTERQLLAQVNPDARFWSINRAFSPGVSRLGATAWTGDIDATWDSLAQQPGELLSYSLSGMPYATCDIGGFDNTPSPELMTRWIQAGVFFPIQRCHSTFNQTPRFPWLYGPDAESAIRQAIDLRYRLIPYYYSLAFATHQNGSPVMRPLIMEFPDDASVANTTDEWLMGRGLLAAPQLTVGGSRTVYLPSDQWYTFGTNQIQVGPQTMTVASSLDQIPMYVRAGTLLPLGPVVENTTVMTTDPLVLQIYPGRDATFNFVEDDGATLAYQHGDVRVTSFSWNDQSKTLSWTVTGRYSGKNAFSFLKALLLSPSGMVTKPATLGRDGALSFQ